MALKKQNSDALSDWDLVLQTRGTGSQKAFAALFNRHRKGVYLGIYQMVKNHELSEDLMIESFAKAFRAIHHYKPSHTLASWLNAVAKNHTLDFLRKKQLESISLDEKVEEGSARPLFQVRENNPDPEQELEIHEQADQLNEVISKLKPRYRRLIELRYFEEKSYEEIAQILDIPLGTVKAQLFRAKDLLNHILHDKKHD